MCSPVAVQGELTLGSSNDLSLVKDLIAGDRHHAATPPSRESSKKAHLGCHIYGIKWLARSQIAYNGRGMQRLLVPATFTVSLCSLVGFLEEFLARLWLRPLPLLEPVPNSCRFG